MSDKPKKDLSILCMAYDTFPPLRMDVKELFGKQIASKGHRIEWILQSEQPLQKSTVVQWLGQKVYLGATNPGRSLFCRVHKHLLALLNDFRVYRLVNLHQYDIVIVKDKFFAALMALMATKHRKTKFVYWLSYPIPEASLYEARQKTARYPFLYRIRGIVFSFLLYKVIGPHCLHMLVQSQQMKVDMASSGIPDEKMTVVPMGYDASRDLPGVGALGPHTMIYIGTLLKTRKLDILIRILAKVIRVYPDAKLYMVGPEELPGDKQLLLDEAQRMGLEDSVVITGKVPHEKALEYCSGATVCMSPFFPTPILNSTSPTKLVEYMSLAKPVVANDHPEQKVMIEASNCGICVAWDESEFADAVCKLFGQTKRELEEMGMRGRRYVERTRTYKHIGDQVNDLLTELALFD